MIVVVASLMKRRPGPVEMMVEDALRFPWMFKTSENDDDALEMIPPPNVERLVPVIARVPFRVDAPATIKVEDAESGPCTFRFEAKVEEAVVTWPDRRP